MARYLTTSGQKGNKYVQLVVDSFLYYGLAIDFTLLVALSEIAAHQANPTQCIETKCNQVLDYAATYLNIKIRVTASNMILHVDSGAAYLVQDGACSEWQGTAF